MQKTIIITYGYGDKLEFTTNYQYKMQLSDSEKSQVDYFTGKQRDNQMDALALALKTALPVTAVIKDINKIEFTATKASMLEMLKRKDDYLATILFEATNSSDKSTTESTTVEQTTSNKSTSKRLIEYQLLNSHGYHELDLNEKEPAKDDKVRKIGISKLSYVFNYGDLKHVLSTSKVDVFTTPLGVVPSNGKVTETRKHTFSENAGLGSDGLNNAKEILIGTVKNTNNDKEYKMYAFEPEEAKVANKTNAAETKPVEQAADVAQAPNDEVTLEQKATTEPEKEPITEDANKATNAKASSDVQNSETTESVKEPEAPVDTTVPFVNNETEDTSAAQTATMQNNMQSQSVTHNPLTGNADTVPDDLFTDYVDEPFNTNGTSTPVQATPTTSTPAQTTPIVSSPQESAKEINDNSALTGISEQLTNLTNKVDELLMNSNDSNSVAQANNDLSVALNQIGLKLDQLITNNNQNTNDSTEIKQKLDTILKNQESIRPKEPDTINELILQESNLTDADMNQIPERIKKYCFDHGADTPMARANYIFQIISYLKDNFNIPEDLKCLSDPELFLKVVHMLSWFN